VQQKHQHKSMKQQQQAKLPKQQLLPSSIAAQVFVAAAKFQRA
jgi:hypothetical protein